LILELRRLYFVLKTDDWWDLADILFNSKNLVHVPQREFIHFIFHLCVVAKTLKQDEALVGASLGNCVLNKSHNNILVVVHWIESAFASFIIEPLSYKRCFWKFLRVVTRIELLTENCIVFDMLLYQLVHTQVQHVVLNSDITTSCINLKTLLMIHDNYFGWVNVP
jgi:hypothetical protein